MNQEVDSMTAASAAEWMLSDIPAYDGGVLAPEVYDAGGRIIKRGEGQASRLQAISETNADEFEAYIAKMQSEGFVAESDEHIESNRFVTLFNGVQRVHVSYTPHDASVHIVLDISDCSVADFSGNGNAAGGAVVYQYGLNRDPGGHNAKFDTPELDLNKMGECNAGLLMVIKCADNSLILVDGGASSQMLGVPGVCETGEPMRRLDRFLHQITGTEEGEKLTISCWYLTHADGDHTAGFYQFLCHYAEGYDLQRICANIPAFSGWETLNKIGELVAEKYPACRELKAHTGQRFRISDVTLQVLYTHEDDIDPVTGANRHHDNNNSSLVMRLSTGACEAEMSLLVTGDTASRSAKVLTNTFTNKTLGVDLLQVAHHGFNSVSELYQVVKADYALFPQAQYGVHKDYPQNIKNPPAVDFIRNIYKSVVESNPNGIKCYFDAYYADSDSTDASAIVEAADVTDPVESPAYYQTHIHGFARKDGVVQRIEHYVDVYPNRK